MRIFFAGIGPVRSNGRAGIWHISLRDPLLAMGHEVITTELDCDLPMLQASNPEWRRLGRANFSQQLLDEVRRHHAYRRLDLFVSYFYSLHVDPGAIEEIRKLDIVTVNFFCDAIHSFHQVAEIVGAYDFCWVPERDAVPAYRRAGATPLHIQMAANPTFWYPVPRTGRTEPVVFAGSLYGNRPQLLASLLRKDVSVQIFAGSSVEPYAGSRNAPLKTRSVVALGRAYAHHFAKYGAASTVRRVWRIGTKRVAQSAISRVTRPAVALEAMRDLYASSHVVLSFSQQYANGEPGGSLKSYVKLRDFEVPMCRALYFPQYSEELADTYEIGREVVAWKTIDELAELISYYLSHPLMAEKVREAGYQRALADHTWERRYRQLFSYLSFGS